MRMPRTIRAIGAVAMGMLLFEGAVWAQGSLTPPGAPAPTMKTLDQIEPRTAITSTSCAIGAPGSYYLVTNLTGVTGQHGIIIDADNVTLDLNGFALIGGPGSVDGVNVSNDHDNITIRNGTVRDWGSDGVSAYGAFNSEFIDLKVCANGWGGLRAGDGSVISRCLARENSDVGIYAAYNCTISYCTAVTNGAGGIYASGGATIMGCTARYNVGDGITAWGCGTVSGCAGTDNKGDGIVVGWNSMVSGSSAAGNTDDGIEAYYSSTVIDCISSFNGNHGIYSWSANGVIRGCTVKQNRGDGIQIDSKGQVIENSCGENGYGGDGAGIHVTSFQNRIEGNHVTANDRGIEVDVGNNLLIRNTACGNSGGASNYVIVAGNNYGQILAAPGSSFTNFNPWANFEF